MLIDLDRAWTSSARTEKYTSSCAVRLPSEQVCRVIVPVTILNLLLKTERLSISTQEDVMADDYLLKSDGIEGESDDGRHKGAIV